MAFRARSKTCIWRPDPPPGAGSNSFSPRFGMTGREALGLQVDKSREKIRKQDKHISFVQSGPASSSSSEVCSSSSAGLSSRDVLGTWEVGRSRESSILLKPCSSGDSEGKGVSQSRGCVI